MLRDMKKNCCAFRMMFCRIIIHEASAHNQADGHISRVSQRLPPLSKQSPRPWQTRKKIGKICQMQPLAGGFEIALLNVIIVSQNDALERFWAVADVF